MKDEKYVKRIILYGTKINTYLEKVSNPNDFLSNEEKVDAVLFNLEQIGETAKKLTEEYKSSTTIEWGKIIGLRNIISHEYEGVDLTIIYNISTNDIPKLLNELKKQTKK